jgi:lysozyme family protein
MQFLDSNFKKAITPLLRIEGGYVEDADDRGGATKYGISSKSYPNLDIKHLTVQHAKNIYYKDYWRKHKIHKIRDFELANEIFDTAVNMGGITSIKFLQRALNILNRDNTLYNDLVVDGIMGRNTLFAVSKVEARILLKVVNGIQFTSYLEIAEKDNSQEKFIRGWINDRVAI